MKSNTLNYNEFLENDHILICYKGPFLERILSLIGEKINILIHDDPRLNKKVFSIFLELTQNIAYYSEERYQLSPDSEKTYGKGTFLIGESDNYFTLTSANLIKRSWAKEILDKSRLINDLDLEGLRSLKRELRSQTRLEGQLGGNIGLVDIALKAGTHLDVKIKEVDNQFSFFTLSIDVPKENLQLNNSQ